MNPGNGSTCDSFGSIQSAGVSQGESKGQDMYVDVLRIFSSDRGSTPRTSTTIPRQGSSHKAPPRRNMQQTILVVDDEEDILELLKYNLEKEGYRALTARNGKKAIEVAQKNVDLIILDVMMPEMDGLEVCKTLRSNAETEDIPVVFLTARDSEVDEVVGLELGADDYITKPVRVRTLIARIKRILRRRTHEAEKPSGGSIFIGEIEILPENYIVRIAGREIPFPRKEFQVLLFLVRHPDRVVKRETLLNEIWGRDVYVIDRTVDVHIRKIREKLGKHAQLIDTVKGVGYRFKKDLE